MNTTHNAPKLLTCEFCHAFNGKSRCGCGEARKARGEKSDTRTTREILNSITLTF